MLTSGLSQPGIGGGIGFFCTAFTKAVNLAMKACRAAALATGTSGTAFAYAWTAVGRIIGPHNACFKGVDKQGGEGRGGEREGGREGGRGGVGKG